uniref:mRNA-decapping enzyme C-terminal domain-containing protein n=1 Tax=Pseudo-nitzschia delicatissima TaxID=44447 RepID=A0A6U0A8G6_9STRA|mmetsp:Transcript_1682/g.3933  ORF Transcript_1682/g.3933 Transcript_1682/m.3933 type:complete len:233 (+) Transcript_1682:105-803(+)
MTKINLNVNEQARKEANMRLLKRSVDRSITDILGGATHVVLYHFHEESQSWEKSDVEGSLSLCVRDGGTRHVLVILNRNSPNNYPMDFTADFQLQKSDPFLIFKNYEKQTSGERGAATIRGIWFPNDNERDTMNELLVGVLKSLKESPPPAPVADRNAATASLFAALNISSPPSQQARPQTETPSPSQSNQQPILDKKSLQLALLSLIQDERFLDLIHAQYLKVHNARASRS